MGEEPIGDRIKRLANEAAERTKAMQDKVEEDAAAALLKSVGDHQRRETEKAQEDARRAAREKVRKDEEKQKKGRGRGRRR